MHGAAGLAQQRRNNVRYRHAELAQAKGDDGERQGGGDEDGGDNQGADVDAE
ncbi:hypothetical protein D3C73_1255670 [compost metagenome]